MTQAPLRGSPQRSVNSRASPATSARAARDHGRPLTARRARCAARACAPELLDFFADRLKVQQREAGVRHDLIDAVFALGGEDDLVRLLARVKALQTFVGTKDGADLLTGYKRAANILKKENWEARREPLNPSYESLVQEADLDKALANFKVDATTTRPSASVEAYNLRAT